MTMNFNCLLRGLPKSSCISQCIRTKYYDYRWGKLRKEKVMKIDLPDFDKARREAKMSPDEFNSLLKKDGIMPPRNFSERPMLIDSTNAVIEPYVPPEGDGVASKLTGKGALQKMEEMKMKGKSMNQLRKIKQFEEDFNPKMFPSIALDIYKEAFTLLQNIKQNETRLHELLTELAYPELTYKLEKRTFRWTFLESIEAPRVVHIRTQEMMNKDNIFAQVTVRFHSKQLISIFDRFGRLAFGSENYPFEMVEYVVFEKHLANLYGSWRMHSKVVPEWSKKSDDYEFAVLRTSVKPKTEVILPKPTEDSSTTTTKGEAEKTASA